MNIIIIGCGNIGFETAKLLAKHHSILIIDLNKPRYLDNLLNQERNVSFIKANALNITELKQIVEDNFQKKEINLDALICTVGSKHGANPLNNYRQFRECFELNVFGNLIPIKAFIDFIISLKTGRIIVISSTAGHHAPKSLTAYAPAKWALENICSSLRSELIDLNITVDVIVPSRIKNKYSKTFITKDGINPERVAGKIQKILYFSKNSNHFIPRRYQFIHILERLFPNLLDLKNGLPSQRDRREKYSKIKINNVLITGASSGLGRDLAYLYSKNTNNLYLIARNLKKLTTIKKEIMNISKCNVNIAKVDMRKSEDIINFISNTEDVDLLINNAGFSVNGQVIDIPIEEYKNNFDINFFGAVLITSELLKKKRAPKKIINILSTTAIAGRNNYSSYSATKSALWGFTRSLRRIYGNETQVLEIIPSTFTSGLFNSAVTYTKKNGRNPKKIKRKMTKLNKMSSEFVAKKIFLAEKKGKEIVYIPLKAKLFLYFEALFPSIFKTIFR